MFGLLKKKFSAKNRAYLIAVTTSDYIGSLDEALDKFLLQYPKYKEQKNNIVDELQWIIATGGLISIRILSDHNKAKETYEQLIEFYRSLHQSSINSSAFDDNYLTRLETKFNSYMVRFNRGIVYRDDTESSYNEALIDVANESMEYITGEVRCSQIMDYDDLFNLQKRTDPNEIELFIKDILGQFVKIYLKEFEKVKII